MSFKLVEAPSLTPHDIFDTFLFVFTKPGTAARSIPNDPKVFSRSLSFLLVCLAVTSVCFILPFGFHKQTASLIAAIILPTIVNAVLAALVAKPILTIVRANKSLSQILTYNFLTDGIYLTMLSLAVLALAGVTDVVQPELKPFLAPGLVGCFELFSPVSFPFQVSERLMFSWFAVFAIVTMLAIYFMVALVWGQRVETKCSILRAAIASLLLVAASLLLALAGTFFQFPIIQASGVCQL